MLKKGGRVNAIASLKQRLDGLIESEEDQAGSDFAPERADIMKLQLTTFVLFMSILASLIAVPLRADEASRKAARSAAEAWLGLVDAEKYAKSWDEAASFFKSKVSKTQWVELVGSTREPFGALKSRQFLGAKYTTELPGAPDGEYVVIQYKASYENKKNAIETITPMKDGDGRWRVSAYFVR